jgi:hypothetical protein
MKSSLRLAAALAALSAGLAAAGPGAHGPGGEHLDAPAPVLSAGASVPRAEAKSEAFELVARVESGALSILVDRYDTNEPVLDAAVEVESGPVKSKATFRREQGDYVVADPQLLKALAEPGAHALVFTITTAKDGDLLEASMPSTAAHADTPRLSYGAIAAWIAAGALVPAGAVVMYLRTRRSKGEPR